jgi:hypothetical protein
MMRRALLPYAKAARLYSRRARSMLAEVQAFAF